MKNLTRILLTALVFCAFATSASLSKEYYPESLGIFVAAKGGVNSNDPPNGIKNGFAFNGIPDFGATFFMPFERYSNFALLVDLAYSTYAYEQKLYHDESVKWTIKHHYLTLGPSLFMSGFVVGLNFGLPMSAESDGKELKTDDLGMMAEVRLGGMFPLLDSPVGRLNLVVNLGYMFSGTHKSGKYSAADDFIPVPASVSLGFNYLFNLVDVTKEWE